MHYVQFGSNISPNHVMPAATHRHVIHKQSEFIKSAANNVWRQLICDVNLLNIYIVT